MEMRNLFVARLVLHFINTTTFASRDFWPRRGASDAHTLQRSVRSEQRSLGRKEPPPGGLPRFSVPASLLLGHSPTSGDAPSSRLARTENRRNKRGRIYETGYLTHAEGNPRDEVVAEAVLEAVENLLAAVADDFREPYAAIDNDEQSALVESGRLRVRGDVGIDEMIPNTDDFGLGAAPVETELVQDPRHQLGDRLRAEALPRPHR